MKVILINAPENPLRDIWAQARVCYSPRPYHELYRDYPGDEKALKLVQRALRDGHSSITRGTWFRFSIAGVSRACSHQLVRHTIGVSWEQQSQRYVEIDTSSEDWYVVPPSIDEHNLAAQYFRTAMANDGVYYRALVNDGIAPEDARYVLSNACKTNLVGTFSFEALANFLASRLCTLAQWEIREVAKQMRHEVVKRWPWVGAHLTIKCIPEMRCRESRGKTCPLVTLNGGKVKWIHDNVAKS